MSGRGRRFVVAAVLVLGVVACGRSDLDGLLLEGGSGHGASGRAGASGGVSSGGRAMAGGTATSAGRGGSVSTGRGGGPQGGDSGVSGAAAATAAGNAGSFAGGGDGGTSGGGGALLGGSGGTEQAGSGGTNTSGAGGTLGPVVEVCEPAFTPDLEGPAPVDAGGEVLGGVAADFDGDGRLDLATALGDGNLSVLLGNGDGTFASFVTYATHLDAVGPGTNHGGDVILSADFDENGTLDLVTMQIQARNIAVLLGDGDGTFAPGIATPLRAEPEQIALGDFDADAHLDVAIVTKGPSESPAINVLYGSGDGTFVTEIEVFTSNTIRVIAAGDLNEDGRTDLVSPDYDSWYVLEGREDRSFAAQENDGPYISPNIADVDADGHLDVLVPIHCGRPSSQGRLDVLFGNGDGTFTSSTELAVKGCGGPARAADVNQDGSLDLVRSASSVLLNDGGGTFLPELLGPQTMGAFSVALGDWNGDGRLDIATSSVNWVSVRFGNGDGSFSSVSEFSTELSPNSVLLADLDADGALDIATSHYDSRDASPDASSVSVMLGRGDGAFQERTEYPAARVPVDIAAADLDHDGWLELVTLGSENVGVMLGAGEGRYQPYTEYAAGTGTYGLLLGDLNDDHHTDLLLLQNGAASVEVRLGYGDGTFSVYSTLHYATRSIAGALADANGDGHLDLLVNDYESSLVRVFLGDGAGNLAGGGAFETAAGPYQLATGDLDGDGNADVVTAGNETLSVLFGSGDGSFGRRADYGGFSPEQPVVDLVVVDFDRDGHLDVILSSGGFRILLGAGDGTFRCFEQYALGGYTRSIGIGDLNDDGRNDLVAATYAGVDVFLNAPR